MKKLFDNKIFKTVYGILRTLFIIIIIIYISFILIQRISGNKSIFGYRLFVVATGSMAGVYDVGDVIAVKDCDVNKLKLNEDIAYMGTRGGLEGKLITHRIVKIEEKEDGSGRLFTTKGIKAPVEDPVISQDQILGKVIGIVPVITQLNHVVRTQLGFFLLIFCPLVIVIMLEILQTVTEIKVNKHEIRKIEKEENKVHNTIDVIVEEDNNKDKTENKNDKNELEDKNDEKEQDDKEKKTDKTDKKSKKDKKDNKKFLFSEAVDDNNKDNVVEDNDTKDVEIDKKDNGFSSNEVKKEDIEIL